MVLNFPGPYPKVWVSASTEYSCQDGYVANGSIGCLLDNEETVYEKKSRQERK